MMVVVNVDEELECEVHVYKIHLEHVSEFKYLGCWMNQVQMEQCSRRMNGRRVAGAIRS